MDNITPELNQTQPKEKKPLISRLRESGCFTPFYLTLMLLFALSLVVYIVARFCTPFAEFWARYPSQGIRFLLAKLTSWIPFSLVECALLLIPLMLVAYLVYAFRFIRKNEPHFVKSVIMPLVAVLLVILTLFFSMFGPCYFRNTLSQNLGIDDAPVGSKELYETAVWLAGQINEVIPEISFSPTGESHMPYDYNTLISMVNDAFDAFAAEQDFIGSFRSNPKPIVLSEPMTYTHISGVYSFMTGEANINVNYPDFVIPYTIAHEMSHQRGIAREDEANMVAFLVCLESSNPYIRYSGLANVLSYVESALYRADKTLYKSFVNGSYPSKLAAENNAYSKFFDKYRDSVANTVTNAVNNTFLQSQGQSQGTKSYGLVVDLTVAYYRALSSQSK